ncbi:MAG: flagellar biosynthesis protein FlhF [Pirellulales bacterium]|nr:flagellar biosynthesis protein FlhF [Pirellulales bacterium]
MDIKTFRAKTMPQALDLVRRELGPEAMVLHTRELHGGLLGRMFRGRSYEIAATPYPPPANRAARGENSEPRGRESVQQQTPAIQPTPALAREGPARGARSLEGPPTQPRFVHIDPSNIDAQIAELQSLVEQLRARTAESPSHNLPPALQNLLNELGEAEFEEPFACELLDRVRRDPALDPRDLRAVRARLVQEIENELTVSGPIRAATGAGRIVALVGPTGVGKTTTIAKLAANYRLRDNRRVGLITVDTYRIAAVEQLRTYAEIIDLPMEVVSTPREVREAVERMRDYDLILMDTAGRSPRDEVRIRELRTMLAEARPDEVHLVLSSAASSRGLTAAVDNFAPAGVTSLIITKLDEATGLGGLVTLARHSRLPLSYLTNGQNVPDDITVAERRQLARMILGLEATSGQWPADSGQ